MFPCAPTTAEIEHGSQALHFGFFSYLGQLGQFPAFNASVELPRYRFRFYTDGMRQQQVTPPLNLPPVHPPETPNGLPESLSAAQKQDLLKFLSRL